jgi:hypothetical protein
MIANAPMIARIHALHEKSRGLRAVERRSIRARHIMSAAHCGELLRGLR